MPGLIRVLVRMDKYAADEFYVLKRTDLRDVIVQNYTKMLRQRGGTRAKTRSSTHTIVASSQIAAFRDKWRIVRAKRTVGA
jgi:hypothetical protein